ncbi:hypothetical protein N9N67_08390 [Bacteriovoracaceae bacterium]|nr:hypothetical protein [Bacteriovoracaceae bacterium]
MQKLFKSNWLLVICLPVLALNFLYAQNSNVLNSDPIDIEGYVDEPRAVDRELIQINSELKKQKSAIKVNKEKSRKYQELGRTTEKLSDVTEDYINDKRDSEEVIDQYNKKIDCLLKDAGSAECDRYARQKREDKVTTQAAAPAPVVVEKAPEEELEPGTFKLGFNAGAANFSSQVESLETEYVFGAKVEFEVGDRFDMGFGFSYLTFDTRDFADRFHSRRSYRYNYYNVYGIDGRQIEYEQWTVDIYGKFFIKKFEKFSPYLAAGLGYNRANLRYTDNDQFYPGIQYQNYQFGDEEYDSSWISARIAVGSDFYFTKNFGMTTDLSYTKSIGNVFNREREYTPRNAPDQERLEELADEVTNAHIFMATVGLIFRF